MLLKRVEGKTEEPNTQNARRQMRKAKQRRKEREGTESSQARETLDADLTSHRLPKGRRKGSLAWSNLSRFALPTTRGRTLSSITVCCARGRSMTTACTSCGRPGPDGPAEAAPCAGPAPAAATTSVVRRNRRANLPPAAAATCEWAGDQLLSVAGDNCKDVRIEPPLACGHRIEASTRLRVAKDSVLVVLERLFHHLLELL